MLLPLNYLKSLNLFIQNKKCKTETQCIKRSRAKAAFGPPLVANTCGQGAIFFKICCRRQTLAGIYFESFYFQASLTIMNPRFFSYCQRKLSNLQCLQITTLSSCGLRLTLSIHYSVLPLFFFCFFVQQTSNSLSVRRKLLFFVSSKTRSVQTMFSIVGHR